MKLIAKTNIKYGPNGETAAAGETLEVSNEVAKALLESGAAEKPTAAEKPAAGKDKD